MIALGLLVLLSPQAPWLRAALFYGAFVLLGAALAPFLQRLLRLPVIVGVGLGLAATALSIASLFGHVQIGPGQTKTFLLPWAGIVFVMWLWPRIPRTRFLELIGERSIVVYTVHFPAQFIFARLAGDLAASTPTLFLTCSLLVGLLLPMAMIRYYRGFAFLFEFPELRTRSRQG